MLLAVTRKVSPGIGRCELTHLKRTPINVELACRQHEAYEHALTELGCTVQSLPAEPDLPDSVFVEDTAIVLDEVAVITRPGAASRRPETSSIAASLRPYRSLVELQTPATLDGGDVLRIGRTLYVGMSGRSNQVAIQQLETLLQPFGYTVRGVPVCGCLHLKSAVTQVAPDTMLFNPKWISAEPFRRQYRDLRSLEIAPEEDYAGNALMVGGSIIYPTCFPRTAEILISAGIALRFTDVSELQKAEGAVTCCSLILQVA
jgi:dimethylargininase